MSIASREEELVKPRRSPTTEDSVGTEVSIVVLGVIDTETVSSSAASRMVAELVVDGAAVLDSAGEIPVLVDPVVPSTSPLSILPSGNDGNGPGTGVEVTRGTASKAKSGKIAPLDDVWNHMTFPVLEYYD